MKHLYRVTLYLKSLTDGRIMKLDYITESNSAAEVLAEAEAEHCDIWKIEHYFIEEEYFNGTW